MKFYKKIIGLFVAMMMVFSMAACGGGNDENAQAPSGESPEEIVRAAEQKMREVTNFDSEMVMDMTMSAAGQTVDMKTITDMSIFSDPLKMKILLKLEASEELGGSSTMEMYADATDENNAALYMNIEGNWYKQAISTEDLQQYDAQESLTTYLDGVTSLVEAGTEKVNDSDATRFDGVITGAELKEAVEASGALDELQPLLAGSDIDAATLYDGLSDITISVWVSEEGYPVKYEMNMSTMMQDLMTKIMEVSGQTDAGLSVDKMIVSITSKNFNNATDFEIPEDAKNSTEING